MTNVDLREIQGLCEQIVECCKLRLEDGIETSMLKRKAELLVHSFNRSGLL